MKLKCQNFEACTWKCAVASQKYGLRRLNLG